MTLEIAHRVEVAHGFDHLMCTTCWTAERQSPPPYLDLFPNVRSCCWCGRLMMTGIGHWSVFAPRCDRVRKDAADGA